MTISTAPRRGRVATISRPAQQYVGWPTVIAGGDGRLRVVCSGGRQRHVCPFGQVHLIEADGPEANWSWHRVLVDGPLDDRDSGIMETASGSLLVTWFTSLTWELFMDERPQRIAELPEDEKVEWLARRSRLQDSVRMRELGCWLIRSTDGGQTWSEKIDTVVGSPHGPLQLDTGELLYPGVERAKHAYGLKRGPFTGRPGAAISADDGLSWRWISSIPVAAGDEVGLYHELHGVQAANGSVIVHIRNHNPGSYYLELLQTESQDRGRTWSAPRPTGIWGRPGHLLRLKDGRLLCTTGHRRAPAGIHAAVSEDHGRTWCPQFTVSDTHEGDFGYPSTAQLKDGSLLTVWYELRANQSQSVLRSNHWALE